MHRKRCLTNKTHRHLVATMCLVKQIKEASLVAPNFNKMQTDQFLYFVDWSVPTTLDNRLEVCYQLKIQFSLMIQKFHS